MSRSPLLGSESESETCGFVRQRICQPSESQGSQSLDSDDLDSMNTETSDSDSGSSQRSEPPRPPKRADLDPPSQRPGWKPPRPPKTRTDSSTPVTPSNRTCLTSPESTSQRVMDPRPQNCSDSRPPRPPKRAESVPQRPPKQADSCPPRPPKRTGSNPPRPPKRRDSKSPKLSNLVPAKQPGQDLPRKVLLEQTDWDPLRSANRTESKPQRPPKINEVDLVPKRPPKLNEVDLVPKQPPKRTTESSSISRSLPSRGSKPPRLVPVSRQHSQTVSDRLVRFPGMAVRDTDHLVSIDFSRTVPRDHLDHLDISRTVVPRDHSDHFHVPRTAPRDHSDHFHVPRTVPRDHSDHFHVPRTARREDLDHLDLSRNVEGDHLVFLEFSRHVPRQGGLDPAWLRRLNSFRPSMDEALAGGDGVSNRPSVSHNARPPPPALTHHGPTIQASPRGSPSRSPSQGVHFVTLDNLSHGPRPRNEYVETPRPVQLPHPVGSRSRTGTTTSNGHSLNTPSVNNSYDPSRNSPVLRQPQSSGLKKSNDAVVGAAEEEHPDACKDSIICSQCGRCRCSSCTEPRELPIRWLCNGKYECSGKKCVEYCSCLCCVRGLFYHWFKNVEAEGEHLSDDPCACCQEPHCCMRWTCIGALSLCMPCLCLYWPLRCGLYCVTSAYNRCYRRGCNCRRDRLPGSRRLLIDSESSST